MGLRLAFLCFLAGFIWQTVPSAAAECPGNPDALGTSRVIAIDPAEHPRIGSHDYAETLPLEDHEVVLTFDDGPIPPYTARVLDALAAECVKATFFLVGSMANRSPQLARRAYEEGHTIGTHTQSHANLRRLSLDKASQEIDNGMASVAAALGDPKHVAPFFRFPYLNYTKTLEDHVVSKGDMIWDIDMHASDWQRITSEQVAARALQRLEKRGRGILLLHDIKGRTAAALPGLLRELKRRGYRIVHVVPASANQPKTVTKPAEWLAVANK